MKVKELIEVLQRLEQERDVVIQGYEGGFWDAEQVIETQIIKNITDPKLWYYGPHVNINELIDTDGKILDHKVEDVYLIPRKS